MSSRATAKPSRPNRPKSEGAVGADDFLGGRISVLQPRSGHRAGSDAVLLAAAVPARAGERVLDVGAGVGAAGLCVAARVPGVELTAVEIDAKLCALAKQNARLNGVSVRFVQADLFPWLRDVLRSGERWDVVILDTDQHAHPR